jgi:hypothetical protein
MEAEALKVKFRAPRTCTKTRDVPGSNWINYPLAEEWEVALDDLCDLMIQTKKARVFLAEWIKSAPQNQDGETEESFTAISACRIERALDYLLHAESELYSQMGDEDKKRAQLSPAKARRFKGKKVADGE